MTPTRSYLSTLRRETLRSYFDSSPTIRLLRADSAPLVIDFLQQVFKSGEAITIGQAELRSRLAIYQEELHESDPQLLTGPPERYLTQWSDHGWLQRFLDAASSEPQFQLTRHSEDVIRFLDSVMAQGKELVGTESRLRMVIDTLDDIVRGASADPTQRLEYLRAQKAAIEEEITAIESGKSVQVYRPSQIRERFQTAMKLLKDLQADFRAVEENFHRIARDVQQRQATGAETRGGILGFALDAEDLMKNRDEGISFYAFVKFLFSPAQQTALMKNIEEIQKLDALSQQHESLAHLRKMVPSLLAEADKVMRTNARLSTTLRRLLDARAAAERVRLANLLRDIRQLALQLGEAPKEGDIQISVDTNIDLQSPFARTFWTPEPTFESTTPEIQTLDPEDAKRLAAAFAKMRRLDFRKLRKIIRELTVDGHTRMLSEVVEHSPFVVDIVEVLGLIQIAHDDQHWIDSEHHEVLTLPASRENPRAITLKVPRVTFRPRASSQEGGIRPK